MSKVSKMRLIYPPCNTNWRTEKPYTRHNWIVKDWLHVKRSKDGEPVFFYHIVCSRCGLKDPRSPSH